MIILVELVSSMLPFSEGPSEIHTFYCLICKWSFNLMNGLCILLLSAQYISFTLLIILPPLSSTHIKWIFKNSISLMIFCLNGYSLPGTLRFLSWSFQSNILIWKNRHICIIDGIECSIVSTNLMFPIWKPPHWFCVDLIFFPWNIMVHFAAC